MGFERIVKATLAMSAAGIIAIAAMHARSLKVQAHEHESDDDLAEIGLRIAPDFINVTGKDPKLVGLGSFIANAQADGNGCHGSDPANEYLPTKGFSARGAGQWQCSTGSERLWKHPEPGVRAPAGS
ncbi:MAG TPA: hypothetical protein VEI01_15985 [Terriglobales bacterium]|nr:hypothetical protein [Terriglobales bacterium]